MAPAALYHDHTSSVSTADIFGGEKCSVEKVDAQSQTPKDLVMQAMRDRVVEIDVDTCDPGEEDAFYVADLGEVYRQHMRWQLNLSRVKPFYGKQTMIIYGMFC